MLTLALMTNPSNLEKHFHRHALSTMFTVNYDFPPVDLEDPAVVGAIRFTERVLHEMKPGSRLVETFTWMRYITSR